MNSYQLFGLLCLLLSICSCTTESIPEINHSDLIGHWDVTVPSGLQFVEFTSDNRVFIGDRGALGPLDISNHYYQDYRLNENDEVENLPADSKMTEISIIGDRMTFRLVSPDYDQQYVAYRKAAKKMDDKTEMINQSWLTVAENGQLLDPMDQKLSYFSKANIFFIKDMDDLEYHMYSWRWNDEHDQYLCYTDYQRPSFIPRETCMSWYELSSEKATIEVDGIIISLVPTTKY